MWVSSIISMKNSLIFPINSLHIPYKTGSYSSTVILINSITNLHRFKKSSIVLGYVSHILTLIASMIVLVSQLISLKASASHFLRRIIYPSKLCLSRSILQIMIDLSIISLTISRSLSLNLKKVKSLFCCPIPISVQNGNKPALIFAKIPHIVSQKAIRFMHTLLRLVMISGRSILQCS